MVRSCTSALTVDCGSMSRLRRSDRGRASSSSFASEVAACSGSRRHDRVIGSGATRRSRRLPRQRRRRALARRQAGGHPVRRELRASHRLRLSRGRLPPCRSQEDDRRRHGAVRPHGLGRPARSEERREGKSVDIGVTGVQTCALPISQRADRAVYLDNAGVVRWRDDKQEVTLFGANYVLPTASDYRAAGYLHADRKKMIDEDMAQFARMGWDGLRLTFWGDWEASDSAGNLVANDHLDLQDYLIARARDRGIYMLFSPIQLYGSNWPDALSDTSPPGVGRYFGKARMGTDPAALAAQVNYLRQILNHVNPYTRVALKDEPAILFIELVNEPWHHPEDLQGSIRYINALTDAVRSTGCDKLVFYNVSQDFRIGEAIRRSKAQGITFGWYPTGLNSGHELVGNYLRGTDAYPDMLPPELARMPRIVYEFDSL